MKNETAVQHTCWFYCRQTEQIFAKIERFLSVKKHYHPTQNTINFETKISTLAFLCDLESYYYIENLLSADR